MDYKKKYEEAERLYRTANADQRYVLESLFPKLRESEDERTRKELITHCRNTRCVTEEGAEKIAKWLAWLEKQGEQKPQRMISAEAKEALYDKPVGKAEPFDIYEGLSDFERTLADICIGWIGEELGWKQYIKDNADVLLKIAVEKFNSVQDVPFEQKPDEKVKPKFKNGQWIVWKDKCYKVNYNGCGYELVDQNGLSTSLEYGTIDENAHIWDIIKDAKDGDVLVHNSITFIFKGIEDDIVKGLCSELTDYILYFSEPEHDKDYYPATKEQRDILFQKMEEAGYSWDDEKKELKKIELKSAWSEEFERMCQETIDWFEKKCFPYAIGEENPARESIKWLKSLKQRIGGEQ